MYFFPFLSKVRTGFTLRIEYKVFVMLVLVLVLVLVVMVMAAAVVVVVVIVVVMKFTHWKFGIKCFFCPLT